MSAVYTPTAPVSEGSWNVAYDAKHRIVTATFRGKLSGADLGRAAARRLDLMEETGANKALIDVEAIQTTATCLDVYDLPAKLYPARHATHKARTALVWPKDAYSRQVAEFFVTACGNRGWPVKTFDHRADAIAWLRSAPACGRFLARLI